MNILLNKFGLNAAAFDLSASSIRRETNTIKGESRTNRIGPDVFPGLGQDYMSCILSIYIYI